MTTTAPAPDDVDPASPPEWADAAPTPADLLARVRAERAAADRAEVAILELAVEWARAHPADPSRPDDESWRVTVDDELHQRRGLGTVEELEGYGIPPVAWHAPAAFAAANGMSTAAGRALVRRDGVAPGGRAGRAPARPCRDHSSADGG